MLRFLLHFLTSAGTHDYLDKNLNYLLTKSSLMSKQFLSKFAKYCFKFFVTTLFKPLRLDSVIM